MIPDRAPKAAGSRDRTVPIATTLEKLPHVRSRYGITRVGDTTGLDRTGIPTYCAIVPNSPDLLGVYNGKGCTKEAARVSAVMEAFERQVAATCALPRVPLTLSHVADALSLDALGLLPDARDLVVDCVPGTELLTGDELLVPHALVRFPWTGTQIVAVRSTNGLASGNSYVEAVYHALTEMVERHVWSLVQVRAQLVPQFYRGRDAADRVVAPALRFPTGDPYLDEIHETIVNAGLDVRVLVFMERSLPYVVLAHVLEAGSDPPMAHVGLGCSVSPAHAVERALTEAVQSRVVDVQAAREDIRRADDLAKRSNHGRRLAQLPKNRWYFDLPTDHVELPSLPDFSTDDLAEDLRRVLAALPDAGIHRVVAVDISPLDLDLAVVRIVAPEFETYAIDGRLGPLAYEEFSPFAMSRISQSSIRSIRAS